MRKSSLRRSCAALAPRTCLALALTACGGTTKKDVQDEGASAGGPASATDTGGQVAYVNTLTQQQVNAMAVSAQDPGALCTALKQAMSNDIKVVTYDSDTTTES